jgi:hypothetical protein
MVTVPMGDSDFSDNVVIPPHDIFLQPETKEKKTLEVPQYKI